MTTVYDDIIRELRDYLGPLKDIAYGDVDAFELLLRDLGYNFDATLIDAVKSLYDPILGAIKATLIIVDAEIDNGLSISDFNAIKTHAEKIFNGPNDDGLKSQLEALQAQAAVLAPPGADIGANLKLLPGEILNLLLARYLRRNVPTLPPILAILDVYRATKIPGIGSAYSRGIKFTRHVYYWKALGELFSDPNTWARNTFGWGVSPNYLWVFNKLSDVFDLFSGLSALRDMSDIEVAAYLAPSPHGAMPIKLKAPIIYAVDEDGDLDQMVPEAGLVFMPRRGESSVPADNGILISPYAEGAVSSTFTLSPTASITLEGGFGVSGGFSFAIRPSGVTLEDGNAFRGAFGAELKSGPVDATKEVTLFGNPAGTRVTFKSFSAKIGGSVTDINSETAVDFFIAAGLTGLSLVIDPGDDGLLSAIVSAPIEVDAGDIAIGWRPGGKIYFEGGSKFSVIIPLDKKIGPIKIHDLGIGLDFEQNVAIDLTITADLKLGPLYAYAKGMGVSAALIPAPAGDGLLGHYDLDIGFISPSAYAVELDADVVTGGGMLSVMDYEYRGALSLKFASFGFSAFAILNTRLPDDEPGFSFVASIFGEFNIALGYGFFLTGLGGMIGLNRTIDTDAMWDLLYSGELDTLIFPTDPIQNAPAILENMATVMPPEKGTHFFGPAARISWSKPEIIGIKLGIIIEIGDNLRIIILGSIALNLSKKDKGVVQLNIAFFGEIDFGAKTISFDASLINSRIASFAVAGDMAVRTGWAPRLEHVASIGGLHPLFPKPANLPDLRRLSMSMVYKDKVKITIEAYTALTPNSVQFGARADLYAKGPKLPIIGQLEAVGWFYFDALIYFNPFEFNVSLGGGLELLRNGNVALSLGFELRFKGPNKFQINGKVWAKILKREVSFGINYGFGSAQSIPIETTDPVVILREALDSLPGFEIIAPATRSSGVSFLKDEIANLAVDPIGGIRLSQNALPLGENIQKVGETRITTGSGQLRLKVSQGGNAIQVTPYTSDFIYGHFYNQSEAQRLRGTAYHAWESGFDIGSDQLDAPVSDAVILAYEYEYIEIPVQGEVDNTPYADATLLETFLNPVALHSAQRFSDSPLATPFKPTQRVFSVNANPPAVKVLPDAFVQASDVASVFDLLEADTAVSQRDTLLTNAVSNSSYAQTLEQAEGQVGTMSPVANNVVHDYLALAGTF